MLTHVQLFVTSWTVACKAPVSMGFTRVKYWSGFPFPSAEEPPDPGIEPVSLALPALAGRFSTTSATWKAQFMSVYQILSAKYYSKQFTLLIE